MRRKIRIAFGSAALVALTMTLAAPLAAAPPQLVINDMDAARAQFVDDSASGWSLWGSVNYVYADFVRYQDGSFARPHTDFDVWLTACPAEEGECSTLHGTADMSDKPIEEASFTSMESASVSSVSVGLCTDRWYPGCSVVAEVSVDSFEWTATGGARSLIVVTPGVQSLVGKERHAEPNGLVEIISAAAPFDAFVGSYDSFLDAVIQNYNEVLFDRG